MSEIITPGERLANLIDRRGIKRKKFAEMTGIIPNTLSRIVNGRQPLSPKYVKRCAEVLDVSEEYLRCETDDPTPKSFLEDISNINKDMVKYNSQQYRFLCVQSVLKSLGLKTNYRMIVLDHEYHLDEHGTWSDVNDPDFTMDENEADELIRENSESASVYVDMYFRDKKLTMDYIEYRRWLKTLVLKMELETQMKMGVYYDLNQDLADDSTVRALRGEKPLNWIDKD